MADNLLILKQGGDVSMVGQVTPLAANSFNLKMAGDSPSDPGLTFTK